MQCYLTLLHVLREACLFLPVFCNVPEAALKQSFGLLKLGLDTSYIMQRAQASPKLKDISPQDFKRMNLFFDRVHQWPKPVSVALAPKTSIPEDLIEPSWSDEEDENEV